MTATLTTALVNIEHPELQENPDGSISIWLNGNGAWITVHTREDCDVLIRAFTHADSLMVARKASPEMHDRVAEALKPLPVTRNFPPTATSRPIEVLPEIHNGWLAPPLSVPGLVAEAPLTPPAGEGPDQPGTSTDADLADDQFTRDLHHAVTGEPLPPLPQRQLNEECAYTPMPHDVIIHWDADDMDCTCECHGDGS